MSEEICRHCGKPIDHFPQIEIEGLQWKHSDGFYNCDGNRGHSMNYAEPAAPPSPTSV